MAAGALHLEAAFLRLDAKFERKSLGKTPEGLRRLLQGAERKHGESAYQMRHRLYSRIYGIMWYSLKIGQEVVQKQDEAAAKSTKRQPTYVYPPCLKAVVRAVINEDIRDYDDPSGPSVYHVTVEDLAKTKWPAAKKNMKNKAKK